MQDGHFEKLYEQTIKGEKEVSSLLVQFEHDYPNMLTAKNVDQIVADLQKKTDRSSIIAELRERKLKSEEAHSLHVPEEDRDPDR